ncbi:hypothetical protein [Bacillus sp. OTU530]|uniref:hypothetical protein n=1 Tax=Bacillus sp. OTU530 TaxID=3043862 RepID=UPI00313CC86A
MKSVPQKHKKYMLSFCAPFLKRETKRSIHFIYLHRKTSKVSQEPVPKRSKINLDKINHSIKEYGIGSCTVLYFPLLFPVNAFSLKILNREVRFTLLIKKGCLLHRSRQQYEPKI